MPWARTNDIHTYYEQKGEGTPLILIHGGGTTHRMWEPQVSYFSQRFKVLSYDVRGHGQSGGSPRKYSCNLYADDLKALIDFLKIEQPVLCGLSLGGMIAQAFAVKNPEAIRGLILADTAAASVLSRGELVERVIFSKHLIKLLLRLMSLKLYVKLAFWFFPKMKPEVKAFLMQEELQMDKGELIKMMDAVYDFQLLELSRIQVPTLILLGEWERKAVFYHARVMKSLIREASVAIIPKAQHVSSLENPTAFNRVVMEYLLSLK